MEGDGVEEAIVRNEAQEVTVKERENKVKKILSEEEILSCSNEGIVNTKES